jgi:hypothetical protein
MSKSIPRNERNLRFIKQYESDGDLKFIKVKWIKKPNDKI